MAARAGAGAGVGAGAGAAAGSGYAARAVKIAAYFSERFIWPKPVGQLHELWV